MPAHYQHELIRQIMLKDSYLTLNECGHKTQDKSKPHKSNGGFILKTNVSPMRVNHVNLTMACTPKTNVDRTLACQIEPTPMVDVFSQRWPDVAMLSGLGSHNHCVKFHRKSENQLKIKLCSMLMN